MRSLPLVFINLGGEMLYILDQRLQAHNTSEDNSDKGIGSVAVELTDLVCVYVFSPSVIPPPDELFPSDVSLETEHIHLHLSCATHQMTSLFLFCLGKLACRSVVRQWQKKRYPCHASAFYCLVSSSWPRSVYNNPDSKHVGMLCNMQNVIPVAVTVISASDSNGIKL